MIFKVPVPSMTTIPLTTFYFGMIRKREKREKRQRQRKIAWGEILQRFEIGAND